MIDLLTHKEIDIIQKNMPEKGPQAEIYKRIFRNLTFDDMHDIYNTILGLNKVTKAMIDILVKRQTQINHQNSKEFEILWSEIPEKDLDRVNERIEEEQQG